MGRSATGLYIAPKEQPPSNGDPVSVRPPRPCAQRPPQDQEDTEDRGGEVPPRVLRTDESGAFRSRRLLAGSATSPRTACRRRAPRGSPGPSPRADGAAPFPPP